MLIRGSLCVSPRRGRGEPKVLLSFFFLREESDAAQATMDSIPTPTSPPSGPMTRARAKALHDKVNSLLSTFDLGSTLDGVLLHTDMLCVMRYEPTKPSEHGPSSWTKHGRGGGEEAEDSEEAEVSGRIIRPDKTGLSGPSKTSHVQHSVPGPDFLNNPARIIRPP